MGKIESIIYYCDICNVKAMESYPTCDVCGKEVCGKCSGDIVYSINIYSKQYTPNGESTYTFDAPENIFRKTANICNECVADKENLKNLFLKDIEKVEKKGGRFVLNT